MTSAKAFNQYGKKGINHVRSRPYCLRGWAPAMNHRRQSFGVEEGVCSHQEKMGPNEYFCDVDDQGTET